MLSIYITEVTERKDTNQYDITIIKIIYCQEQYLHDPQQIDNEKAQKEKISNVYTLQDV